MKTLDNATVGNAKAVMSDADAAAFDRLSPSEQLSQLRAAVDQGLQSVVTDKTMNEVWDAAIARNPNARL